MGGIIPVFPNAADGTWLLSPHNVSEANDTRGILVIRGTIPGIWHPVHPVVQSLYDGQQFTATVGPLAGKTFESRSVQGVPILYEVSNTY